MYMFVLKFCAVVVANLSNRLMAMFGSKIQAAPAFIVDNEQGGRVLRLYPCSACASESVFMSESERKRGRNSVQHRE